MASNGHPDRSAELSYPIVDNCLLHSLTVLQPVKSSVCHHGERCLGSVYGTECKYKGPDKLACEVTPSPSL